MKIRHKITLWVACAGMLTSLVFSLVVFFKMRELPFKILDSELQTTALGVARRLSSGKQPQAFQNQPVLPVSQNRYWIRVYDKDLKPIYGSWLSRIVDLPLYREKGTSPYTVQVHVAGQQAGLHLGKNEEIFFRVRVLKTDMGKMAYWVQVGRSVQDLPEELSDIVMALGLGLGVSTLLLLTISYFFAGRILRPIADINRLTREINEKTLQQRIPLGANRDEIHELSASLNGMFDRLQHSFERQKSFLANASHELKSPVAMLRLFFEEALQQQDLPDVLQQQMIAQNRNVLQMDRLVKTLLDLSVLKLNDALTLVQIDLAALIQSVVEDFLPLAAEGGIDMECDLPEPLVMEADRDKIRRMLINILDNAVKYNRKPGQIWLQGYSRDGEIHLAVSNTGPGIPKEDLQQVFDPFYRVEKSRSLEYGGAGLGLAIVKEIVRLHHGRATMDSLPGSRTCIDIFLPQHQERRLFT